MALAVVTNQTVWFLLHAGNSICTSHRAPDNVIYVPSCDVGLIFCWLFYNLFDFTSDKCKNVGLVYHTS